MKRIITKFIPLIPAALILAIMIFQPSCANTTEAPTGGLKDTIPPVVTRVVPMPGTKNVPVHDTKITFTFNEYVTVKDGKSIVLSPPQEKSPKYKIKGKSLVVTFEEDLRPNTTYTLDLTGAIADNNEGNMFPGFTTFFSTGETIDSMYVTGTIQDCNTLTPIKGATVMLYKDHSDSAVFLTRPDAAVKTDDWGFFTLQNIKDTLYRIYAVVDASSNNIYDPDEDRIAFLDTLFRPLNKIRDSVPELLKYDMLDTTACLARHSDVRMRVFKERPSKQMLMNKMRLSDRFCYVTFMAPDTVIDTLWFKGYPSTRVITEFNIRQDSLLLWLNVQRPMPDTLKLCLRYWKTDTLGVLRPEYEEVSLVDENKPKGRNARRREVQHTDTICPVKITGTAETFEQNGFALEFDNPPIFGHFDSLQFKSINPRQKEQAEKFTIERDSLNLRRYIITPQTQILSGYEYTFKVPQRTFRDINGYWNDSTELKLSLPNAEDLCSFTLNLTGVNGNRYIVDMLDEGMKTILRTYIVDNDRSLAFPYLKPGSYAIRITEDLNRNGIVDTGKLLEHKQPEKVQFLRTNDKDTFEIPERSDISQDLDLNEFFK